MPLKILLPCLVSALALACAGSSPDSSSGPGAGASAGGPRLAWDQFAPSADELRRYSYVLYVDGTAVPLPGASCGTLLAETLTAACTAPLPAMSPGQHTLEMATRVTENGVVLESARSAPITYNAGGTVSGSFTQGAQAEGPVGGGTEGGNDEGTPESSAAASDRPYVIEAVLTGLDGPSALTILPDGRLLIAERGGTIRIAERGDALLPESAAQLPGADAAADAAVSLSLAPDFEASRHVYVGYRAVDGMGAPTGRVMRFREAGGVLGEPAVILASLPAVLAAPVVAFGPDGALYVGTSAADTGEAADLGTYAGKVLRVGLDGTTPPDNPWAASPVYSFGYRELGGFAWEGQTGTLWALDTEEGSATLKRVTAGHTGISVVPLGPTGAARMAFLAADAAGAPVGWRGSLFVAAPAQRCLLRLGGLSASPPVPVFERLFEGEFGRITLVLAAGDDLYIATSNRTAGAAGGDARAADVVYRVRARAPNH